MLSEESLEMSLCIYLRRRLLVQTGQEAESPSWRCLRGERKSSMFQKSSPFTILLFEKL